jgi:hypothetical protein
VSLSHGFSSSPASSLAVNSKQRERCVVGAQRLLWLGFAQLCASSLLPAACCMPIKPMNHHLDHARAQCTMHMHNMCMQFKQYFIPPPPAGRGVSGRSGRYIYIAIDRRSAARSRTESRVQHKAESARKKAGSVQVRTSRGAPSSEQLAASSTTASLLISARSGPGGTRTRGLYSVLCVTCVFVTRGRRWRCDAPQCRLRSYY